MMVEHNVDISEHIAKTHFSASNQQRTRQEDAASSSGDVANLRLGDNFFYGAGFEVIHIEAAYRLSFLR